MTEKAIGRAFESRQAHHNLPEWWNGRHGCLKSNYSIGCVGSSPTLGTISSIGVMVALQTSTLSARVRIPYTGPETLAKVLYKFDFL